MSTFTATGGTVYWGHSATSIGTVIATGPGTFTVGPTFGAFTHYGPPQFSYGQIVHHDTYGPMMVVEFDRLAHEWPWQCLRLDGFDLLAFDGDELEVVE